jgi:hypothetical protein
MSGAREDWAGGVAGCARAAGVVGPPSSRPQRVALHPGEWVSESDAGAQPAMTGPARLVQGSLMNSSG